MLCRSRSLVNIHAEGAIAITLECRSWGCDHCQPVRRRQLINLAISGNPQRFITLTCQRGRFGGPDNAARELAQGWRTLAKRIRRRWPDQRLEYLCVFEATKTGWPHLHILQRGPYIPQRWLSQQWSELVGSPIVDIRAVSNAALAARYVSKYVGKAPHRFATAKRYWHSASWSVQGIDAVDPQTRELLRWQVDDASLDGLERLWIEQGHFPTRVSDYAVFWGRPPPWLRAPSPSDAARGPS